MTQNTRAGQGATVAQLKGDIDSGLTRDKVASPDPGLSPLGTDDEAAGTPASPEVIAQTRQQERAIGEAAQAGRDNAPRERAWLIPSLLTILLLIVVVAGIVGLTR